MIRLLNICINTTMASTIKLMSLTIMWFVISTTVFTTKAYETYDETDQLAEESADEYEDKAYEDETTTNSNGNYNLEVTNTPKDKRLAKEFTDEDEPTDPLQKILPKIKFNCKGKSEGYYADNEFCEVFHYCKTNGFRFTFMCPQETYYNTKLMACEYNSSVSLCKHQINLKINNTFNKILNTTQDIGINPSAGQQIEAFETSNTPIRTSTQTVDPIVTTTTTAATTTVSTTSTTVMADPYLTKRRTTRRTTAKPKVVYEKSTDIKTPLKPQISNTTQKLNETINENLKPTQTAVILPFRGFGRHNNRTKNRKFESSVNYSENSTENSVRIPTNAYPVLNSYKNQLIRNTNQRNGYKTQRRTTTTAPPSLLIPTTKPSTTVSPFEFFNPLLEADNRFPTNSDLYSLSSQRSADKKNRKPPVLTQNYFNTIFHFPSNQSLESEPQIQETPNDEKQNEPQIESFADLPSFLSREVSNQEFMDLNPFNRAPIFEKVFKSQSKNLNNFRVPAVDAMNPSESQTDQTLSISEMIERFKELDRNRKLNPNEENAELSSQETDALPAEPKDETDENPGNDPDNSNGEQMLTVPVLVPTGMSKSFMKQSLGATLLRPTMIPLPESDQKIPAYVLQFQNGHRVPKRKHKIRSKRQIFGWNTPYYRNSFESNSYLPIPSMSSHIYSNGYPMNAYHQRPHIQIGEKPAFMPSAQQHSPYYMTPQQTFAPIPNNFISNNFDNNVYDLSEFSDFYPNRRPNMLMSDDVIPYRSVSLKRPTFKRPPQRNRIPDTKRDGNETQTTPTPITSIPVSPRPHRPTMRPFYSMNSNPFSDFSDESLGEAIKLFDSNNNNNDHFQELRSSDFDFQFNSPRSYSSDFIPITPKPRAYTSALNSRASRVTYSQPPVNSFDPNFETNYYTDNFPPFPQFGDPDYRLPFVDIPGPTHRNLGYRPKYNENDNKKETERKEDNKNTSSVRYSTPYSPEVIYSPETETQKANETERNPNHNYDNVIAKEELQTARSDEFQRDLGPASRLEWHNLVGQYHKPNKTGDNKNDQKVQIDSQMNGNNKYVSYGTRLNASDNNSTVSVKSSVRVVSSLQPEASNQIVISKKLGSSLPSSQQIITDTKDSNIDELYNRRTSDRLLLFNYYNNLNLHNPTPKLKPATTTVSPYSNGKYPSTSHWSIRGWTGHYNPYSSPSTTTTTTTPSPTTTSSKEYFNLEFIDLNEPDITTPMPDTTVPTTDTDLPEPPYEKVFETNLGPKTYYSQKTQSDISQYLNSLSLT